MSAKRQVAEYFGAIFERLGDPDEVFTFEGKKPLRFDGHIAGAVGAHGTSQELSDCEDEKAVA